MMMVEPECQLDPPPESPYLKLIRKQNDDRQQMESANRWRLLDSQTPAHDVGALRRKVAMSISGVARNLRHGGP